MPSRLSALIAAVLMVGGLSSVLPASSAAADPNDPPPVVVSNSKGSINTTVKGSRSRPGQAGSTQGGGVEGGSTQPAGGAPQDPLAGLVNSCLNVNTAATGVPTGVGNGCTGGVGGVAVDPIVLAYSARGALQLPKPAIALNPLTSFPSAGTRGPIVGFQTWFWVDRPPEPLTQRVAAGPVWAVVTATPVSSLWYPGEGGAVDCGGMGTPLPAGVTDPQEASPDCGHQYTEPTGADTVQLAAAITWRVTWVGSGGQSGGLPALYTQAAMPIAVGELQAINTR